jgi:stage II sporulation protein D
MWTPRSTAPARRCWTPATRSFALAALLLGAACAPAPRVTAPVPVPAPAPPGLPRAEPAVRVGIAVDTATVQLGSSAGLRVETTGGALVSQAAAGQQVRFRLAPDGSAMVEPDGGAPRAGLPLPLVVRAQGGGTLTIGERPYRGIALVQAGARAGLTVVNVVDMETYLLGVVPHEIGRVGVDLLEAAKAQAVAARTYAVRYLGRREAQGFDVFATVADQVYGGARDEHDVTSRAVRETAGEVLLHGGEPIFAYYHSTCAGQTAAIEEVWPVERPRPYLVSVVDVDANGRAYDHFSNRFQWTQRWTAAEITSVLSRTLADSLRAPSIGELRGMRVLQRTQSGRIARMAIETSAGTATVGGDRIRWILTTPAGAALNSSKFDVELVRDARGAVTEVVATGGGWGHGIGMCQVGAMGRARAGQDYRVILQTYYPNTELRRLY